MKLQNDFLVDAPLDETWATLLDIQRVAQCLPGATLESDGSDGVYRGSMQVKLGPMTLAYKGTARMAEVEDDAHSATIEVKAKELKGQGTATARIRNRLEPGEGGATHVTVETDLNITGRPAQFGRGIMEDVAGKMLGDFAKRLESEVLRGSNGHSAAAVEPAAGGSGPAPAPAPVSSTSDDEPAALDLGSVVAGPLAKRAATGLGVVALLVLLASLLRGRKGMNININLR
jgi:carbon monoxide dehydrogenase subunit G